LVLRPISGIILSAPQAIAQLAGSSGVIFKNLPEGGKNVE
jgi:hypothetical protein